MKRIVLFSLVLGSAVLLSGVIAAGIASASSSVLCKENETPCAAANDYSIGTEMKFALKAGTKLIKEASNTPTKECKGSAAAGTTSTTGGVDKTVEASLSSLSFSECNCTISVFEPGRITLEGLSETMNALVTWRGAIRENCGTFTCTWTEITGGGPNEFLFLSFTLVGGNEPTLKMEGAAVHGFSSKGGECTGAWTGEFAISTPQPLYVATANTVLCKTTASPCNEEEDVYGKGTAWSAALKPGTKSTFENVLGGAVQCEESSIKGEVTASGWTPSGLTAESMKGSLTSLSFAKCTCSTNAKLSKGALTVNWTEGISGSLGLSGFEISVVCESKGVCVLGTSAQEGIHLEGGNPATIRAEKAPLPTVTAIGECKNAKWSAEYEMTTPKPLYVGLNY